MIDSPGKTASPELPAQRDASSGRVLSIEILRGLAILWVMAFHLYADMTYHIPQAWLLYPAFRDRVGEGNPLAALTALGELILGQGYMGVTVFMILSGLSLTMNASRRPEPPILTAYAARFRRLIVPYWGGVLLFVATIAVIALLQMWRHGGSFMDQWWQVRIAVIQPVRVAWDDVAWALTVMPWLFREKQATVPVGSLWFVELLLQYYLIFPFALVVLRKVGPWKFAVGAIAFSLVARAVFIIVARETMASYNLARYLESLAPFRGSEFLIGMSLGYLLVHGREQMAEWVRSPVDVAGLVVIGVLLIMGATVLGPKADVFLTSSEIMLHLGLAALMLPLLFKAPGRLEVSLPARALVFLGVVSFTALIIDDQMRYVNSFLRLEGLSGPPFWFFLWVVYIPVGTLLAYPLARLFGLLPQQRAKAASKLTAAADSPPAMDLQPAGGG